MKRQFLVGASVLVLTIATAQAQTQWNNPLTPPPPLRRERIPPPPVAHPNWAWRGGYYRWVGGRYRWTPGLYMQPLQPGARWHHGEWRKTPRGYVWFEGRWQ
ncbi:MAG TPA: hypothetical protein VNY78_04825 [Edaphobacter sp.]|nr:hypothetical protein [Edaphobacter sp.]